MYYVIMVFTKSDVKCKSKARYVSDLLFICDEHPDVDLSSTKTTESYVLVGNGEQQVTSYKSKYNLKMEYISKCSELQEISKKCNNLVSKIKEISGILICV